MLWFDWHMVDTDDNSLCKELVGANMPIVLLAVLAGQTGIHTEYAGAKQTWVELMFFRESPSFFTRQRWSRVLLMVSGVFST